MDACDFISLAIRLSNSDQEADLRTAVGRACYASFHLAKQLVYANAISRRHLCARHSAAQHRFARRRGERINWSL